MCGYTVISSVSPAPDPRRRGTPGQRVAMQDLSACSTKGENTLSATLYRSAELQAGTGRTLVGLAVPYGETIDVSSPYEGEYREQFAYGSTARTIAERGHKLRLFTQHERRRLPIGKATRLEEQRDGLHVEFQIAATRDGDDALELVRSGIVDSFSVGFQPVRDRVDSNGVVIRTEVKLHEVSLVSDPAYSGAKVAGIRADQLYIPKHVAAAQLRLLNL